MTKAAVNINTYRARGHEADEISASMPFISDIDEDGVVRRSFWSIRDTGNLRLDIQIGRDIAIQALLFLQGTGDTLPLEQIVREMGRQPNRDSRGIASGFLAELSEAAIRGVRQ